jgi:hypothetical protein
VDKEKMMDADIKIEGVMLSYGIEGGARFSIYGKKRSEMHVHVITLKFCHVIG